MPQMLQESLEVALRLAREASREVLRVYASTDFQVETKADGSPVTRADKSANTIIVRGLHRYFPNDTVLSEELPFDHRQPVGRRVWMVDPLDGTQDFVQRTGDFAVMIGLCISGKPSLGVVAAPVLDRLWAGGLGMSAFEEGPNGRKTLSVREPAPDAELRALVSRTHRPPALPNTMTSLQRIAATATHACLYAITIAMPITGYISVAARGRETTFFELFVVPSWVPLDRALSNLTETAHRYGQYAVYALVALHVAAALYHHFVVRDGLLRRMWPGRSPD